MGTKYVIRTSILNNRLTQIILYLFQNKIIVLKKSQ